ncbi:hypothetical protein TOPH_05761 [Tolypocladium ophioglossoides CBS 100239]|uniref:DNA/RNA-binding protein Alba-like domain-containing protein n=1 Tax=Tolypocladium ophioglossoides (strain CBS 100239) TaxID=1163406 RepID=A0A0L0N7C3_TOLOC|nr:hypothetical protein TOPH_05761 [Tolypocladium ophioglossoides CBS 100239]
MSTTTASNGPKKRKQPTEASPPPDQPKKQRPQEPQPQKAALIGPHEAIVAELQPKYAVLVASVISSTQIRKRVAQATVHLAASLPGTPRLVLLHARTAEVCKLVTIVEHCKRTMKDEGRAWYQYNQLFDLPEEQKKEADVVEETVLDKNAEGSDSDDFEVMGSRFEKAVLTPPSGRTVKSMRVFFSSQPVPELKAKSDVTVQSSEETKS